MESKRPRHRRKPVWRPLSRIGLPLRGDCHSRVHRARHYPAPIPAPNPCPPPLLGAERSPGLRRFKLLSVDDLSPTETVTTDRPQPLPEGSLLTRKDVSSGSDEDYVEDKMNEPKTTEKKQSKLERLKFHNDLMEQFMKASLKKYNNEENLNEDLRFEFVKGLKENFIVEGGYEMYHHFNFEAMQPDSSISLFFAEVIPDLGDCEVTCCKLLADDDNGRCLGCINQGDPELRHPTSDDVYVGGHVDCMFPFLIGTDSEDDSD